jgi:hypothetical protein
VGTRDPPPPLARLHHAYAGVEPPLTLACGLHARIYVSIFLLLSLSLSACLSLSRLLVLVLCVALLAWWRRSL